MKIETKFSIDDVVYKAGTAITQKQHPCPDCGGSKKWKAISPAGSEYEFACPRCTASYSSNNSLSLNYLSHVANVQRLRIGSVRTNTHGGKPFEYMCRETGIGSGTVHDELDLFTNEGDALEAAETKASMMNTENKTFVDRYDSTLRLSDFQLKDARTEQ